LGGGDNKQKDRVRPKIQVSLLSGDNHIRRWMARPSYLKFGTDPKSQAFSANNGPDIQAEQLGGMGNYSVNMIKIC
jgi:hypothetical protein